MKRWRRSSRLLLVFPAGFRHCAQADPDVVAEHFVRQYAAYTIVSHPNLSLR